MTPDLWPGAAGAHGSFISGIGERAAIEDLAGLRIGTPLRLRRSRRPTRGCSFEVVTAEGRPLGWLPREDEDALEAYGQNPEAAEVRVTGIVPAFQRPRVQIELAWPETAAAG
ncbi:hypothetical protein [Paracraurococcus ruber]|nr:hypothetical protein [Paracraurococcus ruber]TDG27438.1 hypothetical protein E2C05_22875 [Paracraurococcus ruber]